MSDSEYTEESFEIPDELALDNVHPNIDMDEELQFQEDILQQTEKIYDVIEEFKDVCKNSYRITTYQKSLLVSKRLRKFSWSNLRNVQMTEKLDDFVRGGSYMAFQGHEARHTFLSLLLLVKLDVQQILLLL